MDTHVLRGVCLFLNGPVTTEIFRGEKNNKSFHSYSFLRRLKSALFLIELIHSARYFVQLFLQIHLKGGDIG